MTTAIPSRRSPASSRKSYERGYQKKWIEALRSGQYQQGAGSLNREGRFCCLGVLCDLIDPNAWVSGFGAHTRGDAPKAFHYRMGLYHGYPPPEVCESAGLDFKEARRLANMNDKGATFEEIAQDIERNL